MQIATRYHAVAAKIAGRRGRKCKRERERSDDSRTFTPRYVSSSTLRKKSRKTCHLVVLTVTFIFTSNT